MIGLLEYVKGIIFVFLVLFVNFSLIGIILGVIKLLNDEKGDVVVCFGIKLLFGVIFVLFILVVIVGFFI